MYVLKFDGRHGRDIQCWYGTDGYSISFMHNNVKLLRIAVLYQNHKTRINTSCIHPSSRWHCLECLTSKFLFLLASWDELCATKTFYIIYKNCPYFLLFEIEFITLRFDSKKLSKIFNKFKNFFIRYLPNLVPIHFAIYPQWY